MTKANVVHKAHTVIRPLQMQFWTASYDDGDHTEEWAARTVAEAYKVKNYAVKVNILLFILIFTLYNLYFTRSV